MTKEIEKEIENASKIIEFDSKDLRDALESQKKETLEKIEEIRKRFRCAACDGAKCEHTLGCQALTELEKFLT